MAPGEGVGTVVGLWRFPVKCMAGEQIAEAELPERGLVGDRGYALVDVPTGKVGIYAVVAAGGTLRTGDPVVLIQP